MAYKQLFVNLNKPRQTISNTNFKPDAVYEAHSQQQDGFRQFIDSKYYETAIAALRSGDLTQKDTALKQSNELIIIEAPALELSE